MGPSTHACSFGPWKPSSLPSPHLQCPRRPLPSPTPLALVPGPWDGPSGSLKVGSFHSWGSTAPCWLPREAQGARSFIWSPLAVQCELLGPLFLPKLGWVCPGTQPQPCLLPYQAPVWFRATESGYQALTGLSLASGRLRDLKQVSTPAWVSEQGDSGRLPPDLSFSALSRSNSCPISVLLAPRDPSLFGV